jgi:hypothetical protein
MLMMNNWEVAEGGADRAGENDRPVSAFFGKLRRRSVFERTITRAAISLHDSGAAFMVRYFASLNHHVNILGFFNHSFEKQEICGGDSGNDDLNIRSYFPV